MSAARDVSFDLERFGWTEEGQLEVVGRWSGLRGRRSPHAALHVAGRRIAPAAGVEPPVAGEPWRALFPWPGGAAAIDGAELELGRTIVVDLPAPRRRRRRVPSTAEVHALRNERETHEREVAELRARLQEATDGDALAQARAEAVALREQLDAAHRREAAHADAAATIAELREQLADATSELERLRADGERNAAVDLRAELAGERAAHAAELRTLSEQADELRRAAAARGTELELLRERADGSERRLLEATERAERDRAELTRLLDAERAQSARLRAERSLDFDSAEIRASRGRERPREPAGEPPRSLAAADGPRQRERAASHALGRTAPADEPTRRLERDGAAPGAASAPGIRRRIDAARAASARRVPAQAPSPASLWAVRAGAALLVAVLIVALVLLIVALA